MSGAAAAEGGAIPLAAAADAEAADYYGFVAEDDVDCETRRRRGTSQSLVRLGGSLLGPVPADLDLDLDFELDPLVNDSHDRPHH